MFLKRLNGLSKDAFPAFAFPSYVLDFDGVTDLEREVRCNVERDESDDYPCYDVDDPMDAEVHRG